MDALKEANKQIKGSLEATIIERNAAHKSVNDIQFQLSNALKKTKTSKHSLKKARAKLEKVREEYMQKWKRSLKGLNFLGKMASTSYRLAVREIKE